SAAHRTQATTAAIMRAMWRMVFDTRQSACLSGVSSNMIAMPASSGADASETWTIVPGSANSVWKAAPMLSTKVSLSRLTVTAATGGGPGAARVRQPDGVSTAIDFTPTLARIL